MKRGKNFIQWNTHRLLYGGSSILQTARPFIIFYKVPSTYTAKFEAVLHKKQNAHAWEDISFSKMPRRFLLLQHTPYIQEKNPMRPLAIVLCWVPVP